MASRKPKNVMPLRKDEASVNGVRPAQVWQCPVCSEVVDIPHDLSGNEILAIVTDHNNNQCRPLDEAACS